VNDVRPAASSVRSAMMTRMSSIHLMSSTPSLYEPQLLTGCIRVTTQLENLEKSGNSKVVREESGKMEKVREKSGNFL